MITDSKSAKALLHALFEASGCLDASVGIARDACSESEFISYRGAVGDVMGEMWDRLIQPILKAHPELTPEGLRDQAS